MSIKTKGTTLPINGMIIKVKGGIMINIQNTGVEIIYFQLVQTVPKYCWVPMSYHTTFEFAVKYCLYKITKPTKEKKFNLKYVCFFLI